MYFRHETKQKFEHNNYKKYENCWT